jgi:ornithine racemase
MGADEIHDSRISNLAKVKETNPNVQTVYIKPPSKRNLSDMVKYADVSLNSELNTIRWISEEAVRQNKKHKIIIMVETGDLREGVMGDHLIDRHGERIRLNTKGGDCNEWPEELRVREFPTETAVAA